MLRATLAAMMRPLLCTGLALSVLSAAPLAGAQDASRVTGGVDSKACAWPPLHFMEVIPLGETDPDKKGACTATLIHPRVVLYAAHCGKPVRLIFKNKATNAEGRIVLAKDIEKHVINRNFRVASDVHVDWAAAVLKKPITDTPVIPMATGCELGMLQKQGGPVIMAGGSPNDADVAEAYVIRWAKTKIGGLSGSVIHMGAGDPTACGGDSGGPLLAKLPDGSWRTIGITSTKTGECGSPSASNNYSQINAKMIAWVIEKTGINVSPCHTPEGVQTPSKACDEFMAYAGDPNAPKGVYDNYCADAKVQPVRNACNVPESKKDEPGEDESSSTTGSTEDEESSTSSGDSGPDDSTEESPDETQESPSGNDPSGKDPSKNDPSNKDPSKQDPSITPSEKTPSAKDSPDPDASQGSDTGDSGSNQSDPNQTGEASGAGAEPGGQGSSQKQGCDAAGNASPWTFALMLSGFLLGRRRRR